MYKFFLLFCRSSNLNSFHVSIKRKMSFLTCLRWPFRRCVERGLFKIAYYLYVFTPAGQLLHNRALRKRRLEAKPPHSSVGSPHRLSTCDVYTIPMLDDNYSYLIVDHDTRMAALVDPCDAEEALATINRVGVQVNTLLITHSHVDHSGGNLQLKKNIPNLDIVGGKLEQVPGVTTKVVDGQTVHIGNTRIQVADTPFHTEHHGKCR